MALGEAEQLVAGLVMARSLSETAASLFYTRRVVLTTNRGGLLAEADDALMRLLFGTKENADGPAAINVLTMLDRMQRDFPGIRGLTTT